MMNRLLFILTLLIVTLSGCATLTPPVSPPKQQSDTWEQQQALLSRLQSWQLLAKIGMQSPDFSGSASLDWQQSKGRRYLMTLSGPLATGSASISGQPGQVTLRLPKGEVFTADNPEHLLQKQLGWKLPVSSLYYWIRGIPQPGVTSHTFFNAHQQLSLLEQQGWQIHYLNYTQVGAYSLPQKIEMTTAGIKVKLVIHSFEPGNG